MYEGDYKTFDGITEAVLINLVRKFPNLWVEYFFILHYVFYELMKKQ